MADTFTAPITVGALALDALEDFKRSLGSAEVGFITMTAHRGLVVHTAHRDISVASATSGYQGTGPDITADILRHLDVPEKLIEKALGYASRHPSDHYVTLWMPKEAIANSFVDGLLGRKSRKWQYFARSL